MKVASTIVQIPNDPLILGCSIKNVVFYHKILNWYISESIVHNLLFELYYLKKYFWQTFRNIKKVHF